MRSYRKNLHLPGLLVIAILALATRLTILRSLDDYDKSSAEAEQARRVSLQTASLLADVSGGESAVRGYLLTRSEQDLESARTREFLDSYRAALARVRADLTRMGGDTQHSADPAALMLLPGRVNSLFDILARTIADDRRPDTPHATTAGRTISAARDMDAIRDLCGTIARAEQEKADTLLAAASSGRQTLHRLLLAGTRAILAFLALWAWFVDD